ncbi:unnamed protein product, partial [Gongylonema pulchrum]|uniref:Uncharacterized protein n=1 Tax=Gongylonema pulchrum TaxID=637853 RepID=A0A183D449_9BILA
MLREAERLGHAELRIQRSDTALTVQRALTQDHPTNTDQRSSISFDQKRAIFDGKSVAKESCYKEFWKQASNPVQKWNTDSNIRRPGTAAAAAAATVAAATATAAVGAASTTPTTVTVVRSNSAISSMSAPGVV